MISKTYYFIIITLLESASHCFHTQNIKYQVGLKQWGLNQRTMSKSVKWYCITIHNLFVHLCSATDIFTTHRFKLQIGTSKAFA